MSTKAEEEREREGTPESSSAPASLAAPASPVFWQELYWFLVITVGGIALAMVVLPPRLAQRRSSNDVETNLRAAVAKIDHLERQYESAIEALETDPFYRDEVMRSVLQVKKNEEELILKSEPPSPDK